LLSFFRRASLRCAFPLSGGLEQNFRFLGVLRVCGFVLCRRVCHS
jgi:hypothetical protein